MNLMRMQAPWFPVSRHGCLPQAAAEVILQDDTARIVKAAYGYTTFEAHGAVIKVWTDNKVYGWFSSGEVILHDTTHKWEDKVPRRRTIQKLAARYVELLEDFCERHSAKTIDG